ncbi:hypothetical protein RSOLAG22IIIB_06224 [Rhizoctonia solani]|uniref:Uncharacterized protein n=1 Tax=Rhizoctonia solani TaxID=456999 RepID=A0A0K6GCK7_9AGAM|nr:hypothetical protein RSOLAG22IIIB_06224 [Rhizoctonia solani]
MTVSQVLVMILRSKAMALGVKEAVIRAQVYRTANRFSHNHKGNLWNGYLRLVAEQANKDRGTRDKSKINALVMDEVREHYRNLSLDEKKVIAEKHAEYRTANKIGSYVSDKSDQHAALAKINSINSLLQSLHQQHDIHFLFVAVRGTPTSYVKLQITTTAAVDKFWTLSNQSDLHAFSARLEAFCVGGIQDLLNVDKDAGLHIRSQIRALIGKKLVAITGDPNATMSYARFDKDITAKYNIVLEGWPFPKLQNLADVRASNTELQQLYARILSNECGFRKLTPAEIEGRAQSNPSSSNGMHKGRAPRSDKGLKCGPQKATLARRAVSISGAMGLTS